MVTTHNLGFPRIGKQRELKFALENYWKGELPASGLLTHGARLRQEHWLQQRGLDWVPVGDFSFYDHILDMSFTLGNVPERLQGLDGDELDNYFRLARGRSPRDARNTAGIQAGEMTKWFDTNYHYIVPEFFSGTEFKLDATRVLDQLAEAREQGLNSKPVIVGPLTYLWLGKSKDDTDRLTLLDRLLPIYRELLNELQSAGVEWLQVDEPILVTELDSEWQDAFRRSYSYLQRPDLNILLTSYFGHLGENLALVCELPVQGLHLDAINARQEVNALLQALPSDRVLSLGVIDGRNIWKTDLNACLDNLEPIHAQLQDRLWLAPSCSLLHVPVDLDSEQKLDPEIKSWLAFALQKLDELTVLAKALNQGRDVVQEALQDNARAVATRRQSPRVNNPTVRQALAGITPAMSQRKSPFAQRIESQSERLNLPPLPTTTIGSFPQTASIRQVRLAYRKGALDEKSYEAEIQKEIQHCIREQERLGLDVLVHGEAERNDMVEYFGEQLEGYAFTQFGWVQSYGSRCVKPPILFGDISRPRAMTVEWIRYAQSLTDKPVKGMLTGPVTMLNWSFVRDDQPRSETCRQLALAIREEVVDLEAAGVAIIQIDEAALREGLPLRKSEWDEYLRWAVDCFRLTANGVRDETQIHTHMCYSEFNDIIESIAAMDADVITIETTRSHMELLDAFDDFDYPNDIGPGVYDIHSPNVPDEAQIVELIEKAAQKIPVQRLWINPDCGLKTRGWDEVLPALRNMVNAAAALRGRFAE